MNPSTLPVTVLSGFAGSGKSTIVDRLFRNDQGVRIAAIASATHPGDPAGELPNGCARYVLPDDDLANGLESFIRQLAAQSRFDAVIVETEAASDPMSVAEFLAFADDETAASSADARLDTMVTVVDAQRFLADYAVSDSLSERGIPTSDDDDRTVVEVLVEQIEFCDVIVLNKTDLASEEEVKRLGRILHSINPRAVLVNAEHGNVALSEVIDTGRFDFDATASAPGWLATLNGDYDADGEADASGVGHYVYRARRPFHPQRFWELLHQEWEGVLRGKGFFWLATRSDVGGSLSQAGGACRHGPAGMWWAAQDRSEWPTNDPELEAEIVADWYGDPDDSTIGDRRQELVLIGIDLDANVWRAKFDACLLTDDEWSLGPQAWQQFSDPFPPWDVEEHEHDHDHDDDHGDDCDCDIHRH
jgi:G3E family GTPase